MTSIQLFGQGNHNRPCGVSPAPYPPGFPMVYPGDDAPDLVRIREQAIAADNNLSWQEASRLWTIIHQAKPNDHDALDGLVSALHAQGLYNDAELYLSGALPEQTKRVDFAIRQAQNAQLRSDFDIALDRSLSIVERFPDHIYGYETGAILLAAANLPREGAEILSRGKQRFPDDMRLILPSIHVAVAGRDWPSAAAELRRLHEQLPSDHAIVIGAERFRSVIEAGYASTLRTRAAAKERRREFRAALEDWEILSSLTEVTRETLLGSGRCRRELGEFEEADLILRKASVSYPGDAEIEANIAQVPAIAKDWQEAARRWRTVLREFPEITAFSSLAGEAFARAGDMKEATTVLDHAIEQDPTSVDLRAARASVAQIAGNWGAAVDRWAEAISLQPDNEAFRILQETARNKLRPDAPSSGMSVEASELVDHPPVLAEENTPSMKEMVKHFESLGDNCEFGLVQRHYGAEPITLFRFVAIEPSRMIELLDADLEPLGDPAHTVVAERGNEYYVMDNRGYYWMHTFIRTQQAGAERYVKQQGARLGYLKRNFLQDLRTGDKIYVCKLSAGPVSDATLYRLSNSLRRFGDNLLLGVRRADEDHPGGTVARLSDHIWVGYMKSLQAEGDAGIDQASWAQVMKKVYHDKAKRRATALTGRP